MFETDPTARHDELRTAGVDLVAIRGSKHEFEAEAVDKVIREIGSGPHDFGTIVERAVLKKVEHDLNTAVGNSVMQGTAGWPFDNLDASVNEGVGGHPTAEDQLDAALADGVGE